MPRSASAKQAKRSPSASNREQIFDAFRRWGYLQADLDPLGDLKPAQVAELDLQGEAAVEARQIYCGTIGAEFMHIPDSERRNWIAARIEAEPPAPDRPHILDQLVRADEFESVMQSRYQGTKRFSLEGITVVIPFLDQILETAANLGAEETVLAMSHRGRLTVMLHTVGRTAAEIFAKFEDVDPRSVLGGGDVKYHVGATGDHLAASGRKIHVHMVSNPSHLEAVDPVAMGRARAKITRRGSGGERKVLPVTLHGDGAFSGQGVLAETLNLETLEGYRVGGTIHVVVNNLIGFTTGPRELHSSRFASDVALRLPIPIFHVNGEDPEAADRVARIAAEYRNTFASDVVVDLIGYRRHGHSEVDDPTITQPLRYRKIESHPPLSRIYAERTGADIGPIIQAVHAEFDRAQEEAKSIQKIPTMRTLPAYWDAFEGGRYKTSFEVETGLDAETIGRLTDGLVRYPAGFSIHPKVKRLLEQRMEMGHGKRPVDFGMAEALAFASLLVQGVPVRLTGQDSLRGTFNQRHAALIDTENESRYLPLAHLQPEQAWFECYNSSLSEAAILGYEYGFARDFPEALVLWEAQFGDFANGAQVAIDQFISSGEDKWGLLAGVVLLLPHGYEGQGPEHSSARIERFLQLAGEDNTQVCQPSTSAQYFHLLRRQALRRWRKPLVVFTPKSMLRHPAASSSVADFARPRFLPVVPDAEFPGARRVLICSGKIGHELAAERKRRNDIQTAILFLDQMYPFPEEDMAAALQPHSSPEIVWVQEEPANMGALSYVVPHLEHVAGKGRVRSVKRSASASPATGSAKAHELEQKTLLSAAFASHES